MAALRAQVAPVERLLECVHCGLCLSACPTYVELGTEMDSPRGRIYLIRAVEDDSLRLSADVVRHLDLCLGCRACETACPSGVRYGRIIEEARSYVEANYRRAWWDRWRRRAITAVFPYPERLRVLLAPLRALQQLGAWRALARIVPPARLVPPLRPSRPLPPVSQAQGTERARVGLLIGCVARELFGATNEAVVRVLNRHGVTVVNPPGQGCCGALHLHAGDPGTARQLARRVIDAFPGDLDAVIVTAAGCGALMKEYDTLLAGDARYAARAQTFAGRVRDAVEFLATLRLQAPEGAVRERVTYHDACHLAHGQQVRAEPRQLLRLIPGIELVELPEGDRCCGSAGSYNLTERSMARRLLERKIDNILSTDATCVAVANPGCSLQIQFGLRARGLPIRVAHPVELLDEAYGPYSKSDS